MPVPFPGAVPRSWEQSWTDETGRPRYLFPKEAPKTQAKDTHFTFPSFILKQKKHGGSKIKIYFPPPRPFPQLGHCNHPSSPAGTGEGEGADSSSWGGGSRGCAELGADLFPNINTRVNTPGKPSHLPRKALLSLAVFREGVGEGSARHRLAGGYCIRWLCTPRASCCSL